MPGPVGPSGPVFAGRTVISVGSAANKQRKDENEKNEPEPAGILLNHHGDYPPGRQLDVDWRSSSQTA
jgi:hypothetical protein